MRATPCPGPSAAALPRLTCWWSPDLMSTWLTCHVEGSAPSPPCLAALRGGGGFPACSPGPRSTDRCRHAEFAAQPGLCRNAGAKWPWHERSGPAAAASACVRPSHPSPWLSFSVLSPGERLPGARGTYRCIPFALLVSPRQRERNVPGSPRPPLQALSCACLVAGCPGHGDVVASVLQSPVARGMCPSSFPGRV